MTHLMKNAVWFGTENDMRWVPAPAANYTKSRVRWRAVDQLLHGGANVRQSLVSHKTLSLSWPVQSQESLSPIVQFLEGNGPYFYLDPLEAQSNVVPPYWAEPWLSVEHGPIFMAGAQPWVTVEASANNYPVRVYHSATITVTTDTNLKIPVPDGHTLYLGVHGTGTSNVRVGTTEASLLPVSSTQRTNLTVSGPTLARVRFTPGTLAISGIIAQVLPNGRVPLSGGFLPGLGHTEIELASDPTIISYSANLPNAQTGISADFVEVGAWKQLGSGWNPA